MNFLSCVCGILCCWLDNRPESECACFLHVLLRQQHEQGVSKREGFGATPLWRNVEGACRQTASNMDAVRLTECQKVV